ncbi:related to AXL2 - required for axial pattern of budding [Melanopsichium pennsylvanicum]|uniref:Related to AXL2 - required for axial pattern of budding n=2 Tax=Melanopsichium pennsylvanicum TaxID=63383 RepID=A0AAJ4XJ70_9BASI|nr:related to AXL2-required for axial pattern of budding [Melanopsichium pennsylvanicum 4]SNX82676.1 related to AXL2 - required for axial pattern of budding [Melanopsichium pennsylvanicum]
MRTTQGVSFAPAWLAALVFFSTLVEAAVRVQRPVNEQLPTIARFGQPYSWSFALNTFLDIHATAPLHYTATGLPSWAIFEPATLSVAGIPPAGASSRTNNTITLTAINPKTGSNASTPFNLITMSGAGPVLNKPLAQQLPNVTTLGARSILPSGAQLLPLGWSFSLGFAGDTFTSDSQRVYLSAALADGSPLPSWMHLDQTTTLWGVAPTDVHTAGSFYTVVVTASDVPGYAGANSSLQMVVSGAPLIQAAPFPTINATAGQSFRSTLPIDSIVDARGNPVNTSQLRVTANTSAVGSWLSYEEVSRTFSGTPPFNMTVNGPVSITVPLTLVSSMNVDGASVPASAHITVFQSSFSTLPLPDINVVPGNMFQVQLGQYVRQSPTPPQLTLDPPSASEWIRFDPNTFLLSGTPPKKSAEPVRVQLSLETMESSNYRSISTQSFTVNPIASLSSPTPLPASSRSSSASSNASSVTSTNGFASSEASSGSGNGLSSKAKFALAASLGGVGGLVMLILLMMCCRRYCAAEDRHFRGYPEDSRSDGEKSNDDHGDDDRTIVDERSPRFGWASLGPGSEKLRKGKKDDEEASPYLDPHSALGAGTKADRSPFSDAMTLAPSDEGHGNPRQMVVTMANAASKDSTARVIIPAPAFTITNPSPLAMEKPKRSSVLNLFSRAPRASKSNRSINSLAAKAAHPYPAEADELSMELGQAVNEADVVRPTSIGLGLEGMVEHNLSQMTTSHSLAARSSWESNLFYDDTTDRGVSNAVAPSTPERRRSAALRTESLSLDSPLEVPVRRTLVSAPMRHRNAHISTSPAFNLQAGFESSPERDDDIVKDRLRDARLSNATVASAGHNRARVGGSVDLDEAVVGYARKVSVEASGTVPAPQQVSIQQGQRNLSQHLENYMHQTPRGGSMDTKRSGSSSHVVVDEDDPFEDAEDDPGVAAMDRTTAENTKRNSAASYVPDLAGAETSAVRFEGSRHSWVKPTNPSVASYDTPHRASNQKSGEDEQQVPTVRAVRQSTGPIPASPIVPGASSRTSIANPQTPLRAVHTSAESATTTSVGVPRPWSANSPASRGGAGIFQTPQSSTTPSRVRLGHNPTSSSSHRRSRSSTRSSDAPVDGATPWSHIRSHAITARPGELLRVSALSGTAAPPMVGGAPGSPGKRSGRKLSYHPVLQDEKYFEYYNTWPEFLRWLRWDDRMQELSGTVPPKFGPTPLSLKLAILARPTGGAPPSPSPNNSPSKFGNRASHGHARNGSNASNGNSHIGTAGAEDEVAAIIVLNIQKVAPSTPGGNEKGNYL